ncbi:hypothetical protein ACP179_01940 (plasmid) [Xenorhabdus stockiae]|uniref:hypothetical protein n=1 Tax=Xenorhabdus stockiae TaxID=351614 RepID=UPI003CF7F89B
MRKVIIGGLALLLFPLAAIANDIPTCADKAAKEFGVPEKIFKALVISNVRKMSNQYGPMGLGKHSIAKIAEHIGSTIDAIKFEPCENYRGAAWWLMSPAGGKEGDIWKAVNRYFYGNIHRVSYPETERVKAIYENL